MTVRRNRFKHRLAAELQIGAWAQLGSEVATEVIAGAGFDFIVIDAEHAPNDVLTVLPQLRIVEAAGASPIVRLPANDTVIIKRYLDIGTQTLLIPFVQSAAEARHAVAASQYPPSGIRGAAARHRSNGYGRVKDYFTAAHAELCLLVQIETREGLNHIEEIASSEGVDALFFGPMDLSASLGCLGEPSHPRVIQAITEGLERGKRCGKAVGVLAPNDASARRFIDMGFDFVSVASDLALLVAGADAVAGSYAGAGRSSSVT